MVALCLPNAKWVVQHSTGLNCGSTTTKRNHFPYIQLKCESLMREFCMHNIGYLKFLEAILCTRRILRKRSQVFNVSNKVRRWHDLAIFFGNPFLSIVKLTPSIRLSRPKYLQFSTETTGIPLLSVLFQSAFLSFFKLFLFFYPFLLFFL